MPLRLLTFACASTDEIFLLVQPNTINARAMASGMPRPMLATALGVTAFVVAASITGGLEV